MRPPANEQSPAQSPPGFGRTLWACLRRTAEPETGEREPSPAVSAAAILILCMLIGVKVVALLLLGVPGHAFFYQGF